MPGEIGLFPDGRWVPRWTRWVALVAIGYGVATEFAGPVPTGPLSALDTEAIIRARNAGLGHS